MNLTFLEAARGIDKEMNVSIMDSCPTCKGSGSEPGTSAERYFFFPLVLDYNFSLLFFFSFWRFFSDAVAFFFALQVSAVQRDWHGNCDDGAVHDEVDLPAMPRKRQLEQEPLQGVPRCR